MIATKKPTGRAMSMPGGLAVGFAVSMSVTLLLALLLTKLILDETMAMEHVGYGTMLLLLIASFLGAAVAQRKIKHRRMLVCLESGAVYFFGLLAVTALFFGGQYTAVGVSGLLILAGCGSAGLITAGKGSARKKRMPKRK